MQGPQVIADFDRRTADLQLQAETARMDLERMLRVRVRIRDRKGRGKIVIEYPLASTQYPEVASTVYLVPSLKAALAAFS